MSTNLPASPQVNPPPPSSPDSAGPDYARTLDPDGWGAGQTFSLRRYLEAIWRYKWLVLLVGALGTAAGVGVGRLIPPEYQVQATIWVHTPSRDDSKEGPIQSSQLVKSSGWVDLLKSYRVLDHVVEELRLHIRPELPRDSALFGSLQLADEFTPGLYQLTVNGAGDRFTLADAEGRVLQRGVLGEAVGPELGFVWTPETLPPGRTLQFQVSRPRDISKRLSGALQARLDRDGNFLRVSMQGSNPGRTTRLLNAIIERYVDVAAEFKRARSRELTEILGEQLDYATRTLREAEENLEDYRVGTITLPSERATPLSPGLELTEDPVFENYFELKIQEEQLRRDQEALNRVLQTARDSALPVQALTVIPSVKDAAELQKALDELTTKRAEVRSLRYRYSAEYPPIQQLSQEIRILEEQTLPFLTRRLIADLDNRQYELRGLVTAASTQLRQLPTRAIEEARLKRRVETAEELNAMLRKRYEEARLATASTIPDVRVLDAAVVPRRPTNAGDIPLVIVAATIAGLGLGLVGAVVIDHADPRVRYPEEVSDDLGLPILGTVPHLQRKNGKLAGNSYLQALEAFRNVRLNLVHAYGAAGPLVVTITSPGAEDGKSLVTFNLARSFAGLNLKTLIIDGDLRRGNLHKTLHRARKPGLSDFLAGKNTQEELVQSTDHENLDFVGCGHRLEAGPELLQSPSMSSLLARFRSSFDVILVDSPPLAAGVDPFVLGTLTGNLLLVLRAGTTNRDLAEAKLDLVDRLPIRILGAVLNDVPGRGVYRYYAYLPGYEARDEDATEVEGQIPA